MKKVLKILRIIYLMLILCVFISNLYAFLFDMKIIHSYNNILAHLFLISYFLSWVIILMSVYMIYKKYYLSSIFGLINSVVIILYTYFVIGDSL